MQAQRAGSNRLVEARLRAYNEMLKAGVPKDEAFKKAREITRRQVNKAHREKLGLSAPAPSPGDARCHA